MINKITILTPDNNTSFTHFSSRLFWVINPTDSDFKETLKRYSTGNDPYPVTHTAGTFEWDGDVLKYFNNSAEE